MKLNQVKSIAGSYFQGVEGMPHSHKSKAAESAAKEVFESAHNSVLLVELLRVVVISMNILWRRVAACLSRRFLRHERKLKGGRRTKGTDLTRIEV